MKKSSITLVLSLCFLATFSQDLSYEVRGKYKHPIKKENLQGARFIRDFIPYYPASWIAEYISVEILVIGNGNGPLKAMSINDSLSIAQKNILQSAGLGADIDITVHYKSRNAVTNKLEKSKMNILVTIVPEKEAEYIGGDLAMKKYLKENAINKISESNPFAKLVSANNFKPAFKPTIVIFTVNEQGNIMNARISKSSEDANTDKILMDAIYKMPKWKPAENAKGVKVKQDFEFYVGQDGC